jgi:tetratricopeptide (TPR) repeat protein
MVLQQLFLSKKKIIYLLLTITFLVFSFSLFNNFVWDDEEQIVNNPAVHSLSNIPQHFFGSTFHTGGAGGSSGIYYKPLMSTSFTILYVIGGGKPFLFRLFQIFLHMANVTMIFLLYRQIFKKNYLAAVLALIFAIHPFNVESVVYISALQDVQFLFFGLMSLLVLIYRRYLKNTKIQSIYVSAILILASMLSKETGALFLFIYPLFLTIFYPKFFKNNWKKIFLSLFSVLATYLLLRLVLAEVRVATQGLSPITRASKLVILLTAPKIIFFYLSTFFRPKHLLIAQHWLVNELTWSEFYWPLLVVLVFLLCIVFLLIWFHQKKLFKQFKQSIFFSLAFFIGISLHLHIIPLDMTVADRWFYLPMIFLLGLIGVFFSICNFAKWKYIYKNIFLFLVSIILILFSYKTILRITQWKDGLTLFGHDIQYVSNSFDLENNYGTELARIGNNDEALKYFSRSVELLPDWWTNWSNMGVIYQRQGKVAEARRHYEQSINNGYYHIAYENLAALLLINYDLDEARQFMLEAVKIYPYNYKLRSYLAIAEYEMGNQIEALKQANYAYQLMPNVDSATLLQTIKNREELPAFRNKE